MTSQLRLARRHHAYQDVAAGIHAAPGRAGAGSAPALIRFYGVLAPLLPEVPTLSEELPGWVRLGTQSILAPGGTPRPIRERIGREVARILDLPDIRERLHNVGFYIQTARRRSMTEPALRHSGVLKDRP